MRIQISLEYNPVLYFFLSNELHDFFLDYISFVCEAPILETNWHITVYFLPDRS